MGRMTFGDSSAERKREVQGDSVMNRQDWGFKAAHESYMGGWKKIGVSRTQVGGFADDRGEGEKKTALRLSVDLKKDRN